MELITRQQVADEAPAQWAEQYRDWGGDKAAVTGKLAALSKPINPDDVDKIIGNKSWTRLRCDECKKDVEAVIRLGEALDYDSPFQLCIPCVKAATKLSKQRISANI